MSERRRQRITVTPREILPDQPIDIIGTLGDSIEAILAGPLGDEFDKRQPRENGFVDRADAILSITNRAVKITPAVDSFDFFVDGIRYTKEAAESVEFDDQDGDKYIYYDETGTLQWGEDFDPLIISRYAFVAFVYWSVSDQRAHLFLDERHGASMSSTTHEYLHLTRGTQLETGLGLTSISADASGNDATSAQYAVEGGIIWDEDIRWVIADGTPQDISPIAKLPVFHLTSAGVWTSETATDYPVVTTGTGRLAWNENVAGTWQLTEVGNNSFVCYHTVASTDIFNPVFVLCGQAEYGNVAAAQAGALTEVLDLELGALASLSTEWVLIATTIWQTSNTYSNAVKGRIRLTEEGDDYIDWRDLPRTSSGGGGGAAVWGGITGTLADQTDLQAAIDAAGSAWESGTAYPDGASALYVVYGTTDDWEATRTFSSGTTTTGPGQTGAPPSTLPALRALTYY